MAADLRAGCRHDARPSLQRPAPAGGGGANLDDTHAGHSLAPGPLRRIARPVFLIQFVSTRTGLCRFRRQPASLAVGLARDRSASGTDQMRPAGGVAALGGKAVILSFAHGLLHGGVRDSRGGSPGPIARRCRRRSSDVVILTLTGFIARRDGGRDALAPGGKRDEGKGTEDAAGAAGPGRESAAWPRAVTAVVPPRCTACSPPWSPRFEPGSPRYGPW
jgi:hypothetical protein